MLQLYNIRQVCKIESRNVISIQNNEHFFFQIYNINIWEKGAFVFTLCCLYTL